MVHGTSDYVPYSMIDWLPWQKKFAWKPVKLNKSGKTVWLRFYYARVGRWINPKGFSVGPLVQNGTLFDVLRSKI
jgi:hypothetical protein